MTQREQIQQAIEVLRSEDPYPTDAEQAREVLVECILEGTLLDVLEDEE